MLDSFRIGVSQAREDSPWDCWRSSGPQLLQLTSWEFPRCLEFDVLLWQSGLEYWVSTYRAAETKTPGSIFLCAAAL